MNTVLSYIGLSCMSYTKKKKYISKLEITERKLRKEEILQGASRLVTMQPFPTCQLKEVDESYLFLRNGSPFHFSVPWFSNAVIEYITCILSAKM